MNKYNDKDILRAFFLEAYPTRWIQPADAEMIMVLSSGKCGTTTLTHLLNCSPDILAYHELAPRLWHLSDRVFNQLGSNGLWEEIYWAARRDIVSVANENGLIYAENNHRASVFAPAVKSLLPKTKFIILWRDFDETVMSGCRWGLYSVHDRAGEGRIRPPASEKLADVREVVAWYWVTLYRWCLKFRKSINFENVLIFPFMWIKTHDIERIQAFFNDLGVKVPDAHLIDAVLSRKYNTAVNRQKVDKIWGRFDRDAAEITKQLTGAARP